MKLLFVLFLIAVVPLTISPQTNVDKTTSELDSLSSYFINNWKISPDLGHKAVTGKPYDANFDDSNWQLLKLKKLFPDDSCWIRKELILPQKILNVPVKGKILLHLTLYDSGILWVNGIETGSFYRDGNFVLTDNAKPGEKIIIALKAYNTTEALRLTNAELILENAEPVRQKIKDFALSLLVGQKLLSSDTYQTGYSLGYSPRIDPGIDKSTLDKNEKIRLSKLLQKLALEVDVNALRNLDFNKFDSSIEAVRSKLKPVKEFIKEFTLFFTSNAHIDAAWQWRYLNTIIACRNTFASVFHLMNLNHDFTYSQSASQYYKWMEDFYPDVFNGIKERIKEGRWEIVGGQWIEPDCNMPDGVSWDRQLLYAQDYFKKNFGIKAKIGWNPDSFGFNWNIPMFYRNAGIDAFVTQKIGWNDTNLFPYRVFWWESPDGSKVLTYFPFSYNSDVSKPYDLIDQLRQFEANTGFRELMILFGVGDHGGGPSLEMINRIEHMKTLDIFPNIKFGTAGDYFEWLKNRDLSDLPVWKNELYLELYRGTYTTRSEMKKYNRMSENLLTETEKFSSLSSLLGGKYDDKDLNDAWEKVMFNQFHDILPGTSIPPVYQDATKYYKKVHEIGSFLLKTALNNINKKINTVNIKEGKPITVYNSLSWIRTDVVKYRLPEGDESEYSIYDLKGKEIASQMVKIDRFHNMIIFIARNVPSLGYRTFILLKKGKSKIAQSSLKTEINKMENEFFKIEIDTSTGWIKQITDKRNGKTILSGEGNKLEMLQDNGGYWDYYFTNITYPLHYVKAEAIETGPVRSIVRLYSNYPDDNSATSFFKQDVILYDGIDRIDFKLNVDFHEKFRMLKVVFPLSISDTEATYEIPYGTIRRSTERNTKWQQARFEVPAERWADLSNNGYGVSLLNNSKYGYDIKGNVMRLSLLRTPPWARYPVDVADLGEHIIDYSLFPHEGDWKEANTIQAGYDFNQPLIPVLNTIHKGNLPEENSFISLDENNLILTSVKKALSSDAWILQWYESEGKDTDAILKLPETPKKIFESNFLEEDLKPVKFEGSKIRVRTKKFSVTTLKVYFK